jgi:anaerobic ribonucleoside-triphosphate reductase activating protein
MTGPTSLRLDRLYYPVIALGPGRRLGVWVQGCSLGCPGCMSKHTWDPVAGRETDVDEVDDVWRAALHDGADGVTISGGEPLEQPAIGRLLVSLARVRDELRPAADILLYTGYPERAARRRAEYAFTTADAVVTGRYVAGRPTRLIWRGSANQKLIPTTARGEERYAPFVNHIPPSAPMQVDRDGADVLLIGIPRAGDLRRLDASAQNLGLDPFARTWTEGRQP